MDVAVEDRAMAETDGTAASTEAADTEEGEAAGTIGITMAATDRTATAVRTTHGYGQGSDKADLLFFH